MVTVINNINYQNFKYFFDILADLMTAKSKQQLVAKEEEALSTLIERNQEIGHDNTPITILFNDLGYTEFFIIKTCTDARAEELIANRETTNPFNILYWLRHINSAEGRMALIFLFQKIKFLTRRFPLTTCETDATESYWSFLRSIKKEKEEERVLLNSITDYLEWNKNIDYSTFNRRAWFEQIWECGNPSNYTSNDLIPQ